LARLVQAADPTPQDRALVVGAGSGYSAAVLSRLAAAVLALEEVASLAQTAKSVLARVGAGNVTVVEGSLAAGWPRAGCYGVILIAGAGEQVPQALFNQLAVGGRLVTVVSAGPIGKGMLFVSDQGEVSGRPLFDAVAPALPGFAKAPAFVF